MAENVKFHQACCSGHIHIFISHSNSVSMKRKLFYLQALSCSLSPLQPSRFWMINKLESPIFRRLSCRSIFIFGMPSSFQECVRPWRYIIIDSVHAHRLLLTSNARIRGIPSALRPPMHLEVHHGGSYCRFGLLATYSESKSSNSEDRVGSNMHRSYLARFDSPSPFIHG